MRMRIIIIIIITIITTLTTTMITTTTIIIIDDDDNDNNDYYYDNDNNNNKDNDHDDNDDDKKGGLLNEWHLLFRHTTKKSSKFCITDPLWGESTDSPHKGPVMQKVFSCGDVIMCSMISILYLLQQWGDYSRWLIKHWAALGIQEGFVAGFSACHNISVSYI